MRIACRRLTASYLPALILLALIVADEIETARTHAGWRQACREMAVHAGE